MYPFLAKDEDIDNWLLSLLSNDERKEHDDVSVASWNYDTFSENKDNFLSQIIKLQVVYKGLGQRYFFIKVKPRDAIFEQVTDTHNMFEVEINFYKELLPQLENIGLGVRFRVPQMFDFRLEPPVRLTLRDVMMPSESGQYKMAPSIYSLRLPHLTLVAQEIAKFHAVSLVFLDKWLHHKDLRLHIYGDLSPGVSKLCLEGLTSCLKILSKRPGNEAVVKFLRELAPGASEYLRAVSIPIAKAASQLPGIEPCFSLSHGDLWTNNLLFKEDSNGNPIDLCIIDWQVLKVRRIGCDLSFFLYTCFKRHQRQEYLKELLETYFRSFAQAISRYEVRTPFPTMASLEKEFRDLRVYGFLRLLMAIPFVLKLEAAGQETHLAELVEHVEDVARELTEDVTVQWKLEVSRTASLELGQHNEFE
ncbi:unnamed protein product [Cyprideis torosa]|uniref:Uncharacterized protein n=1 Tax=Cyprideis torosa TaxID=163714 RepID=A0A7R8ZJ41_9CRUS|nr:unnamed protein product [Cyprideis torosa]CAG0879046.1 unnamed protein product [Cyprideis torosa]